MLIAPTRRRPARVLTVCVAYVAAGGVALVFGFPILWMLLTALKTQADVASLVPTWIFWPTIDNFRRVISDQPMVLMLGNSSLIAVCSTAVSTLAGSAAAYGMTRKGMLGRPALTIWFLFQRAVPPVVLFVPLYVLFQELGLLNTHLGLIAAYTTFELPFVVLIMASFFDDLPPEIGEAAELDGCSPLQCLWLVELPLVLPGIATTAFFCLLFSWNEFIIAMIMSGPATATLPLAVNTYLYVLGMGSGVPWAPLSALGAIIILPAFACTLLMQKYLVRGVTLGAIK
jgi:multiple sugar transport system permease protein